MSSRRVREAGPEDAAALARLRHEFRTSLAPAVESEEAFLERCAAWMEERLARPDDRWRCWVAEDGDGIQGHVWVARIEKVPNPVEEPEAHGYVTNMYVRPGRRGRGLGGRLLEAALDACHRDEVGSVVLWPTGPSRPLYERHGFRATERILELDMSGERS